MKQNIANQLAPESVILRSLGLESRATMKAELLLELFHYVDLEALELGAAVV